MLLISEIAGWYRKIKSNLIPEQNKKLKKPDRQF